MVNDNVSNYLNNFTTEQFFFFSLLHKTAIESVYTHTGIDTSIIYPRSIVLCADDDTRADVTNGDIAKWQKIYRIPAGILLSTPFPLKYYHNIAISHDGSCASVSFVVLPRAFSISKSDPLRRDVFDFPASFLPARQRRRNQFRAVLRVHGGPRPVVTFCTTTKKYSRFPK